MESENQDLCSVEKDDRLIQVSPTAETKMVWMRDDAILLVQITKSVENEVAGLVNRCDLLRS